MGKNMKINKNTICYTSEVGHKNFVYPTTNRVVVKESCHVEELNWISGGSKRAVKILKENLIPLNEISKTFITVYQGKDIYAVVWAEK
jgi:hypothetical protein